MTTLSVWLHGAHVADLDDAAGGGMASLQYTDEAIARYGLGAPALSVTLPVREDAYSAFESRNWLDGLLPEDKVRTVLAARLRLDESDIVGILAQVGRECAGAVTILPPGEDHPVAAGVQWLTDDELAAKVRDLPRAPFGVDGDGRVRISLGGVQGKLVVVRDGAAIGLPLEATPSTHIYKPSPLGDGGTEVWPGLAHAETFALRMVAAAGMAAAEIQVLRVEGRAGVLVRRYDRTGSPPDVQRLHQEDLCQALGLPPTSKYQGQLGSAPTLRHVAGVLDRHSAVPILDKLALFSMVVASVALGNADMHAKNLSLLLDPTTGAHLAPAYDVVPTASWDDVTTALALKIDDASHLEEVTAEHLDSEATSWGIGRVRAAARRREVLDALAVNLQPVHDALVDESGHHPVLDQVLDETRARIARLA